jgi:hypothetical protein
LTVEIPQSSTVVSQMSLAARLPLCQHLKTLVR